MKKILTSTALAVILLASPAFAADDNSAAISGSNNSLIQQTGHDNVLATGSGAFGTTNSGGAGGVASATANPTVSPTISPVIAPVNVTTSQGGRSDSSSTSNANNANRVDTTDVNVLAPTQNSTQQATTGSQSIHVEAAKRNAPPVYAPGLTSGIDTCLGSTSGGVTTPLGGITGGGTVSDKDCVRIKMSRELDLRGFRPAGVAMLCFNDEVRQAMAIAGTPCAEPVKQASSAPESTEWRDRSGYPASGNSSKH